MGQFIIILSVILFCQYVIVFSGLTAGAFTSKQQMFKFLIPFSFIPFVIELLINSYKKLK